jgi:hypothetical protein
VILISLKAKRSMEQDIKLVFLRGNELFPLRRKYHLLFQGQKIYFHYWETAYHYMFIARRICRRKSATICYESPNNQLYSVHHWLYGFCYVPEEGLLETTIWTLLLGPHDVTVDCCLEVGAPFWRSNSLHSWDIVISL